MKIVKQVFSKFSDHFFGVIFLISIGFVFVSLLFHLFSESPTTPPSSAQIFFVLMIVFSFWILSYYFLFFRSKENFILRKKFFYFSLPILFLIIPPVFSQDIYNYIFSARIFNVYNYNPYLFSFSHFPMDPFFETTIATWRNSVSPYGPLFSSLSILLNYFFPNDLSFNLVIFRLISFVAVIYSTFLILKISKNKLLTSAFFFSPLVFIEIFQSGHNDIFILLFILMAWHFFKEKRYYLVFFILTLSLCFKYVTLLVFPWFLVNVWREKKDFSFWFKVFCLCFVTTLFLYLPYLEALPNIINSLSTQISREDFAYYFGIFPLIGNFLNLDSGLTKFLGVSVFSGFYFWLLHFEKKFHYFCPLVFSVFLMFVSTWVQPWYLIWFLPFFLFWENGEILWITGIVISLFSYFIPIGILIGIVLIYFFIFHCLQHFFVLFYE